MKESYIEEIQQSMQLQSTEELHKMLEDHDTEIFEEEAFEAARRTLREREGKALYEPKNIQQSHQKPANDGTGRTQDQGPIQIESRSHTAEPHPVLIIDFNMPFWSIVRFMIKFALASIPAIVILILLFAVFSAIFGGVLASLLHLR
jgi:hypothetical protein